MRTPNRKPLVLRWLDDAGRVETRDPIELNQWHHVAFTYDGSRFTDGIRVYVDGIERALKVNLDQINQNFAVKGTAANRPRLQRRDRRSENIQNSARSARNRRSRKAGIGRDAWQTLQDAREKRDRYYDGLPTVMVMQEMPVARETFVLNRGA